MEESLAQTKLDTSRSPESHNETDNKCSHLEDDSQSVVDHRSFAGRSSDGDLQKGLEISSEGTVGHEVTHVDDKHRHETSVFEGVPGDERKTRSEKPLRPPSFRSRPAQASASFSNSMIGKENSPSDEKDKKTEAYTDHGNIIISPVGRDALGKSQRNQDQRDTSDKKTRTDEVVFVEELVDDVCLRWKMRDMWVMSYSSVPGEQDGDEGNSEDSVYDYVDQSTLEDDGAFRCLKLYILDHIP